MPKSSAAINTAYTIRYPCLQVGCDYLSTIQDILPEEPLYVFDNVDYLNVVEGLWRLWMQKSLCVEPLHFGPGKLDLRQAKLFTRVRVFSLSLRLHSYNQL